MAKWQRWESGEVGRWEVSDFVQGWGRRVSQRFGDKLHPRPASGTVELMKVMVVGFSYWLWMLLWVIVASNEKKTVLHSFKEVVIDFVFRKLKLVSQC